MKIPSAAMPAVKIIREQVVRPATPPERVVFNHYTFLRWVTKSGNALRKRICPLGMLPGAKAGSPVCAADCGLAQRYDRAVRAFARWFDLQQDPDAILEAVWPT